MKRLHAQPVFITRRILQLSPDVCASLRWLCFSKNDDGDAFCCDLLGGDFLLVLCSNKVLFVSVFVACLTK